MCVVKLPGLIDQVIFGDVKAGTIFRQGKLNHSFMLHKLGGGSSFRNKA